MTATIKFRKVTVDVTFRGSSFQRLLFLPNIIYEYFRKQTVNRYVISRFLFSFMGGINTICGSLLPTALDVFDVPITCLRSNKTWSFFTLVVPWSHRLLAPPPTTFPTFYPKVTLFSIFFVGPSNSSGSFVPRSRNSSRPIRHLYLLLILLLHFPAFIILLPLQWDCLIRPPLIANVNIVHRLWETYVHLRRVIQAEVP